MVQSKSATNHLNSGASLSVVVEVTSEAEEKVFPRVFVTDQNPVTMTNFIWNFL